MVDPPLCVLIEADGVVLGRTGELRGVSLGDILKCLLVGRPIRNVLRKLGLYARLQREIDETLRVLDVRGTLDDPPKLALAHRLIPLDGKWSPLVNRTLNAPIPQSRA